MNNLYMMKVIKHLMDFFVLPLEWTLKSKHRIVRVIGIPVFFAWFLPAGLFCIPLIAVAFFALLFERAWKNA